MKKILSLFIIVVICLSACGCSTSSDTSKTDSFPSYDDRSNSSFNSGYKSNTNSTYFSNDYGTTNTKCAHIGCTNYIASTGDTNCCTLHSNKCLDCRCYIDEDAMYCMDCLSDAASQIKKDSYSSKYSYSNSHECYVCGANAYSKYGSYYYCSSCLSIVKAFS